MVELILFALASVGMTNIIVESKIFQPVRWLLSVILPSSVYEVVECHQCCGTWCGFLCGYVLISSNWLIVILCGCAGSLLASLTYNVRECLLSNTYEVLPQQEPDAD